MFITKRVINTKGRDISVGRVIEGRPFLCLIEKKSHGRNVKHVLKNRRKIMLHLALNRGYIKIFQMSRNMHNKVFKACNKVVEYWL